MAGLLQTDTSFQVMSDNKIVIVYRTDSGDEGGFGNNGEDNRPLHNEATVLIWNKMVETTLWFGN